MKEVHININARIIPTFAEFVQDFPLKETDLLFTQKFLYEDYMKALNLPCQFLFYDNYEAGEPTDDMIDMLYAKLKDMNFDRIIGVGGGSVMDSAKMLSYVNVEHIIDVYNSKVDPVRGKKLILIPTTCGTGSEMDAIHAVYLKEKDAELGRTVPVCQPDISVLVPEMLSKLPYNILMHTSSDAIGHCVECYFSPYSNPFIDAFALEGFRINLRNYLAMDKGGPDARFERFVDFQVASAYGGVALSSHPAGYAHACCMYTNGQLHMPHGRMVALFLFPILKLYAKKDPENPKLKAIADIICGEMGLKCGVQEAIGAFDDLVNRLLPKERLRDMGMPEGKERAYAQGVIDTQVRLTPHGLMPLTVDDLTGIFQELY